MGQGGSEVREERDGETSEGEEEEEEEQATILYDVVSYREWEQEPEVVKKKQGDALQGKSRGGWLQLAPPPSLLPPRVEAIQVSRPSLLWVYRDISGCSYTLAF